MRAPRIEIVNIQRIRYYHTLNFAYLITFSCSVSTIIFLLFIIINHTTHSVIAISSATAFCLMSDLCDNAEGIFNTRVYGNGDSLHPFNFSLLSNGGMLRLQLAI